MCDMIIHVKTEIIRIENDEGEGPYFNPKIDFGRTFKHCSSIKYPEPCDDIGIKRYPYEREKCGFKNTMQLLQWFTRNELREMKKHGFKIKRVKGFVTANGKNQILFV